MINRLPLAAAAAALFCLSACEKPAGPTGAAAVAASAAATSAAADQRSPSALPALPLLSNPVFGPDFIDKAGSGDLLEIAEGKLALSRSSDAQIRDFATMTIAAHGKSAAALQAAAEASGQGANMPTALPDEMQAKLDALTRSPAGGFDRAYVADQIAAHQDALGALKTYARDGDTPALKKYAAATLPIVQDHLARAQALGQAPGQATGQATGAPAR